MVVVYVEFFFPIKVLLYYCQCIWFFVCVCVLWPVCNICYFKCCLLHIQPLDVFLQKPLKRSLNMSYKLGTPLKRVLFVTWLAEFAGLKKIQKNQAIVCSGTLWNTTCPPSTMTRKKWIVLCLESFLCLHGNHIFEPWNFSPLKPLVAGKYCTSVHTPC